MISMEDFIGQFFIVDFDGYEPGVEIEEMIRKYRIGGVILFKKNIRDAAQTRRLVLALQEIARRAELPPLFVAIDQEGGVVQWLKEGLTEWPGNMALGATNSIRLSREAGFAMGQELRWMGININFAPVLDIVSHPQSPIGPRAFADYKMPVLYLGGAMTVGMHKAGVIATLKHFPGIGLTSLDSHEVLPELPMKWDELWERELFPFYNVIHISRNLSGRLPAIMSAHVVIPSVDPQFPVSLSQKWLGEILRKQLGFEGLIISDSLLMKAVYERWGFVRSAELALRAGNDMVLALGPHEEQKEAITRVREVWEKGGKLLLPGLQDSYIRILQIKTKLASPEKDDQFQSWDLSERALILQKHRELAQEIADRSATVLLDRLGLIPIRKVERIGVVVFHPKGDFFGDAVSAFRKELKNGGIQCAPVLFSTLESMPELSWLDDLPAVVVLSYYRGGRISEEQKKFIEALSGRRNDVIVIGMGTPTELTFYPKIGAYLAVYSPRAPSLEAAAKALTGRITAGGICPVNLRSRK